MGNIIIFMLGSVTTRSSNFYSSQWVSVNEWGEEYNTSLMFLVPICRACCFCKEKNKREIKHIENSNRIYPSRLIISSFKISLLLP